MSNARDYHLEALTDIWTGSVGLQVTKGIVRERIESGRLVPTGILGSIRWWCEVLVRGLGGPACDPTDAATRCSGENRCVVCELFGCTGWARKFRFDVLATDCHAVQVSQIKQGTAFVIRFTPLRPVRREEWALLDLTLRLIAEYGAVGGKTVQKPSDEPGRTNAAHHRDYGLLRIESLPPPVATSLHALTVYVRESVSRRIEHGDFAWASLTCFWCVKNRHLARQDDEHSSFNRIIGRSELKSQVPITSSWLAGQRQESKRFFSFKSPQEARRSFGFVNPAIRIDFAGMKEQLRHAWQDLGDNEFLTGDVILQSLSEQEATGHDVRVLRVP